MIVHYCGWSWDQMYFDPGWYIGGSQSSIRVHMRSGSVRVHVREVRDGYMTDQGKVEWHLCHFVLTGLHVGCKSNILNPKLPLASWKAPNLFPIYCKV